MVINDYHHHPDVICNISCVKRKPAYAKTKGNVAADQRHCFRYIDGTILILPSEISRLTIFCGCTAQFVSDLAGNPIDRFSHDAAHILTHVC